MTRDELLDELKRIQLEDDEEINHIVADKALLAFINDPEITAEWEAIKKWFA